MEYSYCSTPGQETQSKEQARKESIKMRKKLALLALAVLALCALSGCKQNPSEEKLYAKLIGRFENAGYACALSKLEESDPGRDVPIYNASVWHRLTVDGEEILVYFDESNRADYLCGRVDEEKYGHAARFGLRFVLVYPGDDEGVLKVLKSLEDAA